MEILLKQHSIFAPVLNHLHNCFCGENGFGTWHFMNELNNIMFNITFCSKCGNYTSNNDFKNPSIIYCTCHENIEILNNRQLHLDRGMYWILKFISGNEQRPSEIQHNSPSGWDNEPIIYDADIWGDELPYPTNESEDDELPELIEHPDVTYSQQSYEAQIMTSEWGNWEREEQSFFQEQTTSTEIIKTDKWYKPHKSIIDLVLNNFINEKKICPITMEQLNINTISITSCWHVFNKDSIQTWLVNNNTCPTCKQECNIWDN